MITIDEHIVIADRIRYIEEVVRKNRNVIKNYTKILSNLLVIRELMDDVLQRSEYDDMDENEKLAIYYRPELRDIIEIEDDRGNKIQIIK